jgi:hypothetical protein
MAGFNLRQAQRSQASWPSPRQRCRRAASPDQNDADLAAFLLDANGYPNGGRETPRDTPLQQAMSLKRSQ